MALSRLLPCPPSWACLPAYPGGDGGGSHHLSLPSLSCQDNTRISSAGCLGELCAFLTEEELSAVLQQCLLGRSLLYTRGLPIWGLSVLGESHWGLSPLPFSVFW